tara:strand:- start:650 stop:823 length:174 start_codon:yes stop_codon:yes gene_type:complete
MSEKTIGQIVPKILHKLALKLINKGVMTKTEYFNILNDSKKSLERKEVVINHDNTIN